MRDSSSVRLALSVASGVLMGLSLPMQWGHWTPPNLGFLAWAALVPLIWAVQGLKPARAFWVSWIGMIVGHAIMIYWLYTAVHDFGHVSVWLSVLITLLGILSFSAILSLAPTAVAWIQGRWGEADWAWPLAWASVELLRNYFPFGGFTYCNLLLSQYRYTPLIQVLQLIGPFGFLAIMVWVNLQVARRGFVRALLVFLILLSYGYYSIHRYQTESRTWPMLRVALIQGNIPQDEKWDEALAQKNWETYVQLTASAMQSHPDLVVWPEASYPGVLSLEKGAPFHTLESPILLGAITESEGRYHNSAALLSGDGQVESRYDKYHLVPFGEYVPLSKLFFFVRTLAPAAGDLQGGAAPIPLMMGGMPIGVLICYEDMFPEIARTLVQQGSTLLINMTNDAWYGWSSSAEQHLAGSVLRAVENGRTLVRATNTGVSAVIAADGQIQLRSALFERGVIVTAVRLSPETTLYTQWGTWVDLGLPGLLALGVIRRRYRVKG